MSESFRFSLMGHPISESVHPEWEAGSGVGRVVWIRDPVDDELNPVFFAEFRNPSQESDARAKVRKDFFAYYSRPVGERVFLDDRRILKTVSKEDALRFLEPYLESDKEMNASIQKIGGIYAIEVSEMTDSGDCDEDEE